MRACRHDKTPDRAVAGDRRAVDLLLPPAPYSRPCRLGIRKNAAAIPVRGSAMSEPAISPPPGLGWRRFLARLVLWFECLLPALLPGARVAGVFLCVALLDLLPMLPWW